MDETRFRSTWELAVSGELHRLHRRYWHLTVHICSVMAAPNLGMVHSQQANASICIMQAMADTVKLAQLGPSCPSAELFTCAARR